MLLGRSKYNLNPGTFLIFYPSPPPSLKDGVAVKRVLLFRTFTLSEPCDTNLPLMPQQGSLTPGQ